LNRKRTLRTFIYFGFGGVIPGNKSAITSKRDHRVVFLVKGYLVHRVDCLVSCISRRNRAALTIFSVGLKAEIIVSPRIILGKILVNDTHSAFDRPHNIAFAVSEAGDSRGSKFEVGIYHITRVILAV
jgi:hypothetical protein